MAEFLSTHGLSEILGSIAILEEYEMSNILLIKEPEITYPVIAIGLSDSKMMARKVAKTGLLLTIMALGNVQDIPDPGTPEPVQFQELRDIIPALCETQGCF